MPVDWRSRLKTIAITVLVTSCVWLAGGTWFYVDQFGSPVRLVNPNGVGDIDPPARREVEKQHTAPATKKFPQAEVRPGLLTIPVAGVRAAELTDTFTQARDGGIRRHDAIDILAPRGTPVLAAAPGSVEKLFMSKAGGNTVYIRSADRRRIYYYAHLDGYAPGLREGARVGQGQQIGTVGFSGNADPGAPHLHFEIITTTPQDPWSSRRAVLNPYPLLTRGSAQAVTADARPTEVPQAAFP